MLLRSPQALGVLYGDGSKLWSLALSPDGGTLAVGDNDGTVILFDTETRERIGDYQAGSGGVPWLGFHPRHGSLAVAAKGPSGSRAHLHIIDAATQRLRRSIPLGRNPADPGSTYIPIASYAPDERSVIVGYKSEPGPLFLRRFDLASGSRLGRAVRVTPQSLPSPPADDPGREPDLRRR